MTERRQTSTWQLVDTLVAKIVAGEYPAGFRLPPERDLAKRLSVGRNQLREALKIVGEYGLVSARQGSGIEVRDFRVHGTLPVLPVFVKMGVPGQNHATFLQDLFDVNRFLFMSLVSLACDKAKSDGIDLSRAQACASDVASAEEARSAALLEYQVLREICLAMENQPALWLFNSLKPYQFWLFDEGGRPVLSIMHVRISDYHQLMTRLFAAIEQGDEPEALAATREYFDAIDAAIRDAFGLGSAKGGCRVTAQDKPSAGVALTQMIIRKIVSGSFPAGFRLPPEKDLAERYAVGRNLLRESLKVVEQIGLCYAVQGSGVTIVDFKEHGTLPVLPAFIESGMPGVEPLAFLKDVFDVNRGLFRSFVGIACARAARAGIDLSEARQILRAAQESDAQTMEWEYETLRALCLASQNQAAVWLFNSLKPYQFWLFRDGEFPDATAITTRLPSFFEMIERLLSAVDDADAGIADAIVCDYFDAVSEALFGPPISA